MTLLSDGSGRAAFNTGFTATVYIKQAVGDTALGDKTIGKAEGAVAGSIGNMPV